MSIIDRVVASSTFVAATAAIIGGIIQITKNADELYHLPSQLKGNSKTKSTKTKNQQKDPFANFDLQRDKSNNKRKSGLPKKVGVCRICSRQGYTEWHHIISQGHAKKTKQRDLITNPGNVVELCKPCHDQTTASKSRYLLQKKEGRKNSRFWHSTNRNGKKVKS